MVLLEFYEAIQQPRLATITENQPRRNQVVPVMTFVPRKYTRASPPLHEAPTHGAKYAPGCPLRAELRHDSIGA